MARRPIVGGNWKCNPEKVSDLAGLVANMNSCDTADCDVYVCPSSLHVGMIYNLFTNGVKVAPQNCNFKGCGAYTGEMAVDQMASMGIEWVLLGHSERRGEFGLPTPPESLQLLATKLAYVLEKGLKCVFCIGEPLPIREKGIDAVIEEMAKQLEDIKGLLDPTKVVIAYEPVWAIGTGVTASPDQAQETHQKIREWIAKNVSGLEDNSGKDAKGGWKESCQTSTVTRRWDEFEALGEPEARKRPGGKRQSVAARFAGLEQRRKGPTALEAAHLQVLGLEESGDWPPEEEEVKAAFRRRSFECHPDKGGSAEEFSAIAAAYKCLTGASGKH